MCPAWLASTQVTLAQGGGSLSLLRPGRCGHSCWGLFSVCCHLTYSSLYKSSALSSVPPGGTMSCQDIAVPLGHIPPACPTLWVSVSPADVCHLMQVVTLWLHRQNFKVPAVPSSCEGCAHVTGMHTAMSQPGWSHSTRLPEPDSGSSNPKVRPEIALGVAGRKRNMAGLWNMPRGRRKPKQDLSWSLARSHVLDCAWAQTFWDSRVWGCWQPPERPT